MLRAPAVHVMNQLLPRDTEAFHFHYLALHTAVLMFYEYELCHKKCESKAGVRLKSAVYDCCSSAVLSAGAVQYPVGRPSDGGLIPGGTNSMVFSASSQGRVTHCSAVPEKCVCLRYFFLL